MARDLGRRVEAARQRVGVRQRRPGRPRVAGVWRARGDQRRPVGIVCSWRRLVAGRRRLVVGAHGDVWHGVGMGEA